MPPQNNIPNGSEIENALKEFEGKSAGGAGSVSVDLPQVEGAQMSQPYDSDVPAMIRLVIKLSGGSVDEKQAQYVLLVLVVLMLGVSFYLFFGGGNNSSQVTPAQLDQMKLMAPQNVTQ